eukprot:403331374
MAEEFNNQFSHQVQTQNYPIPKSLNVQASEFNPRKLSKQSGQNNQQNTSSSNQTGIEKSAQNWVPQKKNEKKQQLQWKRKDQNENENINQSKHMPLVKAQSEIYQTKKEKKSKPNIQKLNSMHPDYDHFDELKSVQKQISLQNQSANSLLGFTFQEDDYPQHQGTTVYGYSYSNQFKSNNGRKRRGGGKYHQNYRPAKEYSVQSAFKFIVKRGKDYMLNLFDPNEVIEWKDVVTVIFNMTNADDVQCPICLENLNLMVAPKITKCGHILCWPCVLQYLAFERVNNWKRCPLCNESIYKHELKNVKIVQIASHKEGSLIKFNLMVRNKANIIVKDKETTKEREKKRYEIGLKQIFEEQKEEEKLSNKTHKIAADQDNLISVKPQSSSKRQKNKKKRIVMDQQHIPQDHDKNENTDKIIDDQDSKNIQTKTTLHSNNNSISQLAQSSHLNRTKLPTQKFPTEISEEYHSCRFLLSDKNQEQRDYEKDLAILMENFKLMESCQEYQKIPYINEAIEYCHKEIQKLNDPEYQRQLELQQDEILDFQEKKRVHNKKQTLKSKQGVADELEENSSDFYYFYQSSTGENVFLHPLCLNVLQQEYKESDSYPNQIEAQVLEINNSIADIDDPEFYKQPVYHHLPDGAPYSLVEVDLSNLVSDQVYRQFNKEISYRERHRKRKLEHEEKYAGKIDQIQNEKFEQIKRQVINSVNTESHFLVPGVVRNYQHRESQDTLEDQKSQVDEEEEVKQPVDFENEQLQPRPKFDKDGEKKMWHELGELIVKDKYYAQSLRKDGFRSRSTWNKKQQ